MSLKILHIPLEISIKFLKCHIFFKIYLKLSNKYVNVCHRLSRTNGGLFI